MHDLFCQAKVLFKIDLYENKDNGYHTNQGKQQDRQESFTEFIPDHKLDSFGGQKNG
jgi:hypothetical protein